MSQCRGEGGRVQDRQTDRQTAIAEMDKRDRGWMGKTDTAGEKGTKTWQKKMREKVGENWK